MRVVLIQPNVFHSSLATISAWDVPSLGLAYLGAVLEGAKIEVSIIDAHIEQLQLPALLKRVESFNPHIIGIPANGFSAKYALRTIKYLRNKFPKCLYIMGGPFPTADYSYLIRQNYSDICVLGEGEITVVELIDALNNKKPLQDVKGLAYMNGLEFCGDKVGQLDNKLPDHIIVTSKREVIDNINNIPFPAWHLFPPISRYRRLRGVTKRPYVPLITSRGCPYNCNWCTKNIHGYKFRARSPENIFEEIKHDYQRYGAREFIVMDDVFTLDYMRVKKLCYLIVKSGMDIFLNIYNGVRADAIDDSIIKFLKAVGINRITVGVESGNQNIVNKIGKALNLKRVIEAVRLCRKNHLAIDGFFIIGHPYDTLRTIEQTIQFAIRADFDHAYFFLATPFMGTKLYDIIKTEGKLLYEFEKGSDFHIVQGKATCETKNLSALLLEKKYNEAYRRFYFRPRKILSLILLYSHALIKYGSIDHIIWLFTQTLHLLKMPFKKRG